MSEKKETFFQKERRLKSRKQSLKMTYKKGLFLAGNEIDRLIEWLKQPDVLVRVHSSGELNDETEFVSITVEGFLRANDSFSKQGM